MGVASGWVGLSLRRVVGFGGRVCGGKPSTNGVTNKRMDDVQKGVASDWAGLSTSTLPAVAVQRLRRVLGFGGRVRGVGRWSTDGKRMNGWRTLRTGRACPWGDSGFWRARPWGKSDQRMGNG
jgi:hypothetical protein